jgi:hypothetical protein
VDPDVGLFADGIVDEPMEGDVDASGIDETEQPVAWAMATEQLFMDAMDGVPGKRIQWWTATHQYHMFATGPLPVATPSMLPMSSVQMMSSEAFAVATQATRPAALAYGTLPAAISATV